jgi:hypothetical protein
MVIRGDINDNRQKLFMAESSCLLFIGVPGSCGLGRRGNMIGVHLTGRFPKPIPTLRKAGINLESCLAGVSGSP